jgi:hypothetical protein
MKKILFLTLSLLLIASAAFAGSQTYTSGVGNWTVPANVHSVSVTMAGGGGPTGTNSNTSGAGSILSYNLLVTPGALIYYGVGSIGGNTTFGPANGVTLIAYAAAANCATGGSATDGTNTATGGACSTSTSGGNGQTVSAGGGLLCGGGGAATQNVGSNVNGGYGGCGLGYGAPSGGGGSLGASPTFNTYGCGTPAGYGSGNSTVNGLPVNDAYNCSGGGALGIIILTWTTSSPSTYQNIFGW